LTFLVLQQKLVAGICKALEHKAYKVQQCTATKNILNQAKSAYIKASVLQQKTHNKTGNFAY
jgi:hypothetical protein